MRCTNCNRRYVRNADWVDEVDEIFLRRAFLPRMRAIERRLELKLGREVDMTDDFCHSCVAQFAREYMEEFNAPKIPGRRREKKYVPPSRRKYRHRWYLKNKERTRK